MNFEFFIARRIVKGKTEVRKISRPVIRISVWAIALGILIMILAIATGNGLRKEIKNKIISFGGHVQILNYQPTPTYEQVPVSLDAAALSKIKSHPNVRGLQPFGRKAGIIKNDKLFEGAVMKGVTGAYNWQNFEPYLQAGKIPNYGISGYNDSVLVSTHLAKRLVLEMGDKFEMYFVRQDQPPLLRKFIVAGLYKTDFEDIDESFIIGDLKHISRLNKWDSTQVGGYEIFLDNTGAMAATAADLRLDIPYEYDALTAEQLNNQIFQWLALFDINIIIILVIIIAVATVNMSIALLILIMERTQMVGTLKALGATNSTVQKIFLANAAFLIAKGLFWGNLIGIGLGLLQQQFGFIKLDPATYYVSQVSVDLNPMHILALNAGTLLICLISLVLPSLLITRISPVKALRFE